MISIATANSDCDAVRSSSPACVPAIGNPRRPAEEIANTIGREPTSKVHWLILSDTSALSADNLQRVRTIVSYIDSRPDRKNEDFRLLANEAMAKAWPCKKG